MRRSVSVRLRPLVGEGLHRLPARIHALLPPEQRSDLRHWCGRYAPWEEGFDLSPPSPRSGETIGPPDFVGVGVQLGGALWWCRLVLGHPNVSAPRAAGPASHFLSHFCTKPFGEPEINLYHRWFPRPAGTISGEWTPSYMAQPWVAPLLSRAAPAARLLIMVRDPIDRIRLGLAHTADTRAAHVGSHIAEAVDRGFYAAQLRRLLDYFPAAQVLTLQYERCVREPVGQLASTYRFLGLEEAHPPVPPQPPPPETAGQLSALDPDTTNRLVEIYASDVSDLVTLVPELDLSLWPNFFDSGTGRRAPG